MSERFTFLKPLSQKAHGQVWEVRDNRTNNLCIAKIAYFHIPEAVHQLKTEMHLLSLMDGKGTPLLLEMEERNSALILYEQKLEGQPLNQWLETSPTPKEKREVLLQLTALLKRIHELGWIYLDLKEDNIFIDDDQVWLLDFNAAIPSGSRQVFMANPNSLPPESQKGSVLDGRADQIGLGHIIARLEGQGSLSWKCLQEDPENRFDSLDQLEIQLKKKQRPALWSMQKKAFASFCLALLLVLPVLSGFSAGRQKKNLEDPIQSQEQLQQAISLDMPLYSMALNQQINRNLFQSDENLAILAGWTLDHDHALMAEFLWNQLSDKQKQEEVWLSTPLAWQAGKETGQKEIQAVLKSLLENPQNETGLDLFLEWLMVLPFSMNEASAYLFEDLLSQIAKWKQDQLFQAVQVVLKQESAGMPVKLTASMRNELNETKQGKDLLNILED